MAEPETVAGSRLNKWAALFSPGARRLILAIEAEARAAGAARYEAALTSLLGEVGFMRSCVASGERLDKADLDRQDKAMAQAVALLAAAPLPEPLPQGDGLRKKLDDCEEVLANISTERDMADIAYNDLWAAVRDWVQADPLDRTEAAADVESVWRSGERATPSRPAEERKP